MRYFILSSFILLLTSAGVYKKFFNTPYEKEADIFFMSFNSQGEKLEMAYVYKKPIRSNGKTVVLLHGKNFSTGYWKSTIGFLLEKGYIVIAPEQVGFGRSSQPLNYQFTFQQLALNTKLLLDSLHCKQAIIIGHSMGGMLATRFALMFPEICSQLILENPIGLEDWKLQVPYSSIDKENEKEMNKTRQGLKEYMTTNYFHNTWKPEYEALLDENEKFFLNNKHFPAYAKNMALTTDMVFTQPVCYEFKNLVVPVTLMIGQEDRTVIGKERIGNMANNLGNYKELGIKTAAEIKNCRLIKLNGLGHIPHIENFKLFCDSLAPVIDNGRRSM